MNQTKEKSPATAATVSEASPKIQSKNTISEPTCKDVMAKEIEKTVLSLSPDTKKLMFRFITHLANPAFKALYIAELERIGAEALSRDELRSFLDAWGEVVYYDPA